MTDCLLVAPGPTVGDEHHDIAVSQQGGLRQPGGDQDVLRSLGHRDLPLPDHFLLQSGEDVQHHLPLVLRHLGRLEDGAEGDEDDAVLGGVDEGGEVVRERLRRFAGHEAGHDGVGHDGSEAVPSKGSPVVDKESCTNHMKSFILRINPTCFVQEIIDTSQVLTGENLPHHGVNLRVDIEPSEELVDHLDGGVESPLAEGHVLGVAQQGRDP